MATKRDITRWLTLRKKKEALEEALKEVTAKELKYKREIVPSLLRKDGLVALKTEDYEIAIKECVFCQFPTVMGEELADWLCDHGGEYLIDHQIVIAGITNEDRSKLYAQFGDRVLILPKVNTNSLKKYFREALGLVPGTSARLDKEEVPREFGLYITDEATAKEVK